MDMTASIEPRSDQINAEDLLTGPRTVTVERVSAGAAEQPFDFHLVETPGRAYRPSKTMRRVIVTAWGSDTAAYIGRRLTLYREPTIKFGKDEVGGIRISHLSDITAPIKLALTITRGKREQITVLPLADAPQRVPGCTDEQRALLSVLLDKPGMTDADKIALVSERVGRPVKSARDLNRDEAAALIDALEGEK